MTLWFDVEDLFHYAQHSPRLSGVQRLAFELYAAIEDVRGQAHIDVGYVRVDEVSGRFVVTSWSEVERLVVRLTTSRPALEAGFATAGVTPPAARSREEALTRRLGRGVAQRLPKAAQPGFERFCALQMEVFRTVGRLVWEDPHAGSQRRSAGDGAPGAGSGRHPAKGRKRGRAAAESFGDTPLDQKLRPGDWLLSFGASWHRDDYAARLRHLKAEHPIQIALLIYDLIPWRRPEWCHHTLVDGFGAWLREVVPLADSLFAISDASKADLEAFIEQAGLELRHPVARLRIGSAGLAPVGASHPAAPSGAAVAGSHPYVLFVSTIEARKNHLLMMHVWRRLLERRDPRTVPTLVFAGRIGWLVEDLLQQLANAHYLNGKVVIVENPSDAELTALYAGCSFTVFPSFFEGWGLPVTESLAHGKPCLISNTTSLPEAGGTWARYFDPYDIEDAYRAVAAVLDDPALLVAWEEEIRRGFHPPGWTESARALLDDLRSMTLA